ncbi:MAG: polyribonucleotide nucleotidyltransferase [Epsilonproteobacteria bacterium]|nr:polyribonucleotide nucleotidyltransferase [Campylobacterota bacterium]
MSKIRVIDSNNLREKYFFDKVAKQASGAVLYQIGDAVLLSAVTIDMEPVEEDFLPLTVQYIEKSYAAAKIPAGFIKRETKPGDFETLTSRIIDRSLRPLFPKGFNYPVVITVMVLSSDSDVDMQIASLHSAMASLYVSDIPITKALAGVRVGKIDGEVVVNPTLQQQDSSTLDLLVVGDSSDILMIEMCVNASLDGDEHSVNELDEDELLELLSVAQKATSKSASLYEESFREFVKSPIDLEISSVQSSNPKLYNHIASNYREDVERAILAMSKSERSDGLQDIIERVSDNLNGDDEWTDIDTLSDVVYSYKRDIVRSLILDKGIRADGRALDEIRDISIEINFLPSVHGSALFTRGQTQALVTSTIGDIKSAQSYELIGSKTSLYETFMVHYNFPAFSVGEAKRQGPPGRRELGHGNLAKRALEPTLELNRDMTIRIVSEILESNGSSSMATVCGGSLALRASEIETKKLVAGIAMGLVTEGDRYAILSDIMGLEDHDGDMDFKITGTRDGITALQMDIKLGGVETKILREALYQAKRGRLHILNIMEESLKDMTPSQALPSTTIFEIDSSDIPAIIGKGGSTIKDIIERYGVNIDIDRDANLVKITGDSKEQIEEAKRYIESLISVKKPMEYEINRQYRGRIKKILDFGMFVEMPDGYDALLHISKVSKERVDRLDTLYSVGDDIDIIVLEQKGKKVELCTPDYMF